MKLLAPFVILLGVTAALYKTIDVWPLTEYTLQKQGMHEVVVKDVTALRTLVTKGQLGPQQAQTILEQKYGTGQPPQQMTA